MVGADSACVAIKPTALFGSEAARQALDRDTKFIFQLLEVLSQLRQCVLGAAAFVNEDTILAQVYWVSVLLLALCFYPAHVVSRTQPHNLGAKFRPVRPPETIQQCLNIDFPICHNNIMHAGAPTLFIRGVGRPARLCVHVYGVRADAPARAPKFIQAAMAS